MPPPSDFRRIEINIDVVADLDLHVTLTIGEFVNRDLPFGFISDIDQYMGRGDADDPSLDHLSGLDRAQALLEHRLKFASAACIRALFLFFLFCHANQLRSV